MITKEQKQTIISDNKRHASDTGSPEVQISLIHTRINDLNLHFSVHKKDHLSKRGLLKLVSQRKRLLSYLKRKDLNSYRNLIQKLGLRK